MAALPFKTYNEATAYFGVSLPGRFVDDILSIDNFCQGHQLDTL
jgi:hypothetical protein